MELEILFYVIPSSLFYVESFYGGKKYSIKFEDGGEITQDIKSEKV